MRPHISFSEFKIWRECAYKHKLKYIDKIDSFIGNEFTAFGKAIHDVCEKAVLKELKIPEQQFFENRFLEELTQLKESDVSLRPDLINSMRSQGRDLAPLAIPELRKKFGSYQIISAEEGLYEDLDNHDIKFKGFIDLVIKTNDGRYHVIDWKTCSWGWDSKKKSDTLLSYQLSLYKHFFAKKHSVDLDKIDTYFALLKRTAKAKKVEIFKVSNGKVKIKNCLKQVSNSVYNIQKKNFIKNKLSCDRCEFYKTEHCP